MTTSFIKDLPSTPSKIFHSLTDGTHKEGSPQNIGFKIFIVVTVVLAAIVVVAGILALMAGKGTLPPGDTVASLRAIGDVNSYVMIAGGVALFILGIVAWGCHLSKDHNEDRTGRSLTKISEHK